MTTLIEFSIERIAPIPYLHKALLSLDTFLYAFECALNDLCTGMLPLGGSTKRGHGCFTGELYKNGTKHEPDCK